MGDRARPAPPVGTRVRILRSDLYGRFGRVVDRVPKAETDLAFVMVPLRTDAGRPEHFLWFRSSELQVMA